jgi:hypothetical protein
MDWSRRKFLTASTAAPMIGPSALELLTRIEAAPAGALDQEERRLLVAAMDEIIPPGDGMPSASQAGGLEYLDRVAARELAVGEELKGFLADLKKSSDSFERLEHEGRVSALTAWEAAAPKKFGKFRDYIYEAYYTQPAVWKLIGYEFYATDHQGPHMKPFDESILAEVKKKPRLYREA